MGHLTSKDAYKSLEERINLFTQSAAPTETLYKILEVLFSEKEAKMMALMVDSEHNGIRKFVMPPPMAGFSSRNRCRLLHQSTVPIVSWYRLSKKARCRI